MANDELGRIKCNCGKTASVYQAKRKGAHLYSRCPDCGLDQRTGARVQNRLYWETDFNGGGKPPRPEGVSESPPEKVTETEPKKPAAGSGDYVPPGEPVTEKVTETEPKNGLKAGVGLIFIMAALGGALWKL